MAEVEQIEREPQAGQRVIIFDRDEELAYSLTEAADTLGAMVDPTNVFSAKAGGSEQEIREAFLAAVAASENTPDTVIIYGVGGSTSEEINSDSKTLSALLTGEQSVLGQRKLILVADHMIKFHEATLAEGKGTHHIILVVRPFNLDSLEKAFQEDVLPFAAESLPVGASARRTPPIY